MSDIFVGEPRRIAAEEIRMYLPLLSGHDAIQLRKRPLEHKVIKYKILQDYLL